MRAQINGLLDIYLSHGWRRQRLESWLNTTVSETMLTVMCYVALDDREVVSAGVTNCVLYSRNEFAIDTFANCHNYRHSSILHFSVFHAVHECGVLMRSVASVCARVCLSCWGSNF